MSANSGPVASTKADSASKPSKASYDHLDINKLYKSKTSETVTKTVTQKHGMQALGKALPARRPGQVGSLKSENSSESNSATGTQNSSNAVTSNSHAHTSPNQPQQGWTSSAPPPPGSSSPRPAQIAPGTGPGHPQDKSWNGGSDRLGSYPSQRFAQEFPSLDSGMDTKPTTANNSGPTASQSSQSLAKGQDNQYGPGPILRPQTEGSWIQGGGRGMSRPGHPEFSSLNPPSREYAGPERGNMGGPTPPPMSLGQGGPGPQQMPGYGVPPFRGIMPPQPFMFPNGPPPGPGVFYPGMPPRFGMQVPPSPPRPQLGNHAEQSREREPNRGGNRGPPVQRPTSHFTNKPIIKDEDLKRMDEIGVQDGGWASVQDDVDYSKTISFGSDEEEGKGDGRMSMKSTSGKALIMGSRGESRKDERENDKSEDQLKFDKIPERRPKILDRQQSSNFASSASDMDDRRSREDEERKPPQGYGPTQVHPGYRRQPFEDKGRDERRANAERGGRRANDRRDEIGDNWRSVPPRPYEDDRKGFNPRNEARNPEQREFGVKPHMSNLPPRLLKQQYQTGAGSGSGHGSQSGPNQRQTPSPGTNTGKDKDSSRAEWESDQDKQTQDRRRESDFGKGKREGRDRRGYDYDNRFGDSRGYKDNDANSPPSRTADSSTSAKGNEIESPESYGRTEEPKPSGTGKTKMSWADEMDDDETLSGLDDRQSLKFKAGVIDMRYNQPYARPDFYPKEERQKRVIIAKHQRKVADMQSEKAEPVKETKQQPPPAVANVEKKHEETLEKPKPTSAWGDKDSREKLLKSGQESSPGNADASQKETSREDRKSADRESSSTPLQNSSSSSSVPGRSEDVSFSPNTVQEEQSKSSGKYASHRGDVEAQSARSDSVSDVSDRDHLERESTGSQDQRKKGPIFKPSNQDRLSRDADNESYDKFKRYGERDRRDRHNTEREGSDDGYDKSSRGARPSRYPPYNARGGSRGHWDRDRGRGRGRGASHFTDRQQRRSESERDPTKNEREVEKHDRQDVDQYVQEERRGDNTDDNNMLQEPGKDEMNHEDETQRGSKKDREVDAHGRHKPKNNQSSKRIGGAAGGAHNQRSVNNKIEGYGPPSDQKPFSNPGGKGSEEDSVKGKDKSGESGQVSGQKDNTIPSLMAFEISPPSLYKKGSRERDFHGNNRGGAPRMQRGSGGEYNERERFTSRTKRGGKIAGSTVPRKEGEESEEWTDNESDTDSRKSGGTGSKSGKDGVGFQQPKKKSSPPKSSGLEKTGDPTSTQANSKAGRANEKKSKQVKYPLYEARSAQSQLPPRLAKQRDSQAPPTTGTGTVTTNGVTVSGKEPTVQPTKGMELAAPPATNAWEKPIATAFRPEKASSAGSTSTSGETKELEVKQGNSQLPPPSNSPSVSSSTGATVLDGTNPPSQTMIFENRNFKGGFDPNSKSSKLPEAKKDSLSNLETSKGLGSVGIGKAHPEETPELDFGAFNESSNSSQAQTSSMMQHGVTSKTSTTTSMLQQAARHAFDHQSPISPCAAELTEKIQQVKRVWETPTMAVVHEQSGVFGGLEDGPFHSAFGSDSFKTSDGGGRGDFGHSSLQQGSGGFSGGSSPSLSAIAKPESSSSPNSANSRQPNKVSQQAPQLAKAPGHQPIPTPFNNYGIEPQNPIGTKNFGNISMVAPKVMYQSNVPMTLEPFQSQFTQFQSPGANVMPFSQGGSVLIRPVEQKSMYPTMYGQSQVPGVASQNMGHGQNHNSASPGPTSNSGPIGSNGGAPGNAVHMNVRSSMVNKPVQQNRNASINQQPLPGSHPNYYHSHPNTLPTQQMHKTSFGPANGAYSDGSLFPHQHMMISVGEPMFNLGPSFDSPDLRSGPTGPVPPGTPPVQNSSNFYYSSNNNPCVYPPTTPSQNYGHPFNQSLKLPGFNSASGSSDAGSNLSSQRIREPHSYLPNSMPNALEPLPQAAMKSGHDHNFVVRQQQSWNHGNEYVHQMWNPTPNPIQRPIFPQSTAPVMPGMVQSTHFMQGPAGAGIVGGKPQNQGNDTIGNNQG